MCIHSKRTRTIYKSNHYYFHQVKVTLLLLLQCQNLWPRILLHHVLSEMLEALQHVKANPYYQLCGCALKKGSMVHECNRGEYWQQSIENVSLNLALELGSMQFVALNIYYKISNYCSFIWSIHDNCNISSIGKVLHHFVHHTFCGIFGLQSLLPDELTNPRQDLCSQILIWLVMSNRQNFILNLPNIDLEY